MEITTQGVWIGTGIALTIAGAAGAHFQRGRPLYGALSLGAALVGLIVVVRAIWGDPILGVLRTLGATETNSALTLIGIVVTAIATLIGIPGIVVPVWLYYKNLSDKKKERDEEEAKAANLKEDEQRELERQVAEALERHRAAKREQWSKDPFGGAGDKLFTRLSLLLPLGSDATDPWKKQDETYSDLNEVLAKHPDFFALVLLGDPGSGKSTLLQRLDIEQGRAKRPSYYLSLRHYTGEDPGAWLEQQWNIERVAEPSLPELHQWLSRDGALLLLDALNENQAARTLAHKDFMMVWQTCIHKLKTAHPKCRVIFSCRTLDYSGLLNSDAIPVPHLYIEKLNEPKMLEFCEHYLAKDGAPDPKGLAKTVVADIFNTKKDNLYGTALFLRMLTRLVARDGKIPTDSAALFTAFIRDLLIREREKPNPLVISPGALAQEDLARPALARREDKWESAYELPERGPLFRELAKLAYQMQLTGGAAEGSQLTLPRAWMLEQLKVALKDDALAEQVFRAAMDLHILEEIDKRDAQGVKHYVQFVHQLMQEYFAGRKLAKEPEAALAAAPWMEADTPAIAVTLPDAEPLPPISTPWDESMLFGAIMCGDKETYVSELMQHNLPLAGRAAASVAAQLSSTSLANVRTSLTARMREPTAAIRARIDAGRALGVVGDPRFPVSEKAQSRAANKADFIEPPTIPVAGGVYEIGNTRNTPPWKEQNKAPPCPVEVGDFDIAQYPVTNAEFSLFITAGGYENDQFWSTEAAKQWRRGETTYGCWAHMWEIFRHWLRTDKDIAKTLWDRREISIDERDNWVRQRDASDESFQGYLTGQREVRTGRLTKPAGMSLVAFSNPIQPVCGIGWFEANAYCAWLSERTGATWRLPTEAEWEVAARLGAPQDVLYPWGNEFDPKRCNTSVTRVRCTTPVGAFPLGDTAQQLSDMCGNVFEWTSSIYEDYPYDPQRAEGEETQTEPTLFSHRVLRGGSWYYGAGYAQFSFRLRYHPGFRARTAGFRIVRERPKAAS